MEEIVKYINNLDFEYVITYSGLRGIEFEKLEKANEKRIIALESELLTARFMQQQKHQKRISVLQSEIDLYDSRIIDKYGIKHKSTKSIKKLKKGDLELNEIFTIFNRRIEEQIFSMCMPIYRDALVFYNSNNSITGILQICFGCESIIDEEENLYDYDHRILPKLKEKLASFGHEIEDKPSKWRK